jgi:hypothetical protein
MPTIAVQMLVYNAVLKSFGYLVMHFKWNDAGTVDMKMEARGLPATNYVGNPRNYDMEK